MTHDDFCPNPDPDVDTCVVCTIIAQVRRDERDVIEGDQEMDLEEIKETAFQRGYEKGQSSPPIVEQTHVSNNVGLDHIKTYILNNMKMLSLEQTNALYGLYTSLGGK